MQELRPTRRWLRFSIRGILIFTLIFGVGLGWWINHVQTQQVAVAAIRGAGGSVSYHHEIKLGPFPGPLGNYGSIPRWGSPVAGRTAWAPAWLRRRLGDEPFQDVAIVALTTSPLTRPTAITPIVNRSSATDDEVLERAGRLPTVQTMAIRERGVTDRGMKAIGQMLSLRELVIFPADRITDAGFVEIGNLKNLQILYLQWAQLTDRSLAALSKLTNLEQLMIDRVDCSDQGLAALANLHRLKFLWIGGVFPTPQARPISDGGLEALAGLTDLEVLRLDGPEITDGAIMTLAHFPNLKELRLNGTRITPAGQQRLEGAVPGLKVMLFR